MRRPLAGNRSCCGRASAPYTGAQPRWGQARNTCATAAAACRQQRQPSAQTRDDGGRAAAGAAGIQQERSPADSLVGGGRADVAGAGAERSGELRAKPAGHCGVGRQETAAAAGRNPRRHTADNRCCCRQ